MGPGLVAAPAVVAVEEAAEGGEGLDEGAIALVLGHGAVGEAEGEGGIGIGVLAVDREAGLGDAGAVLSDDAGDLLLLLPAELAADGVELLRQRDHGIGARGDGLLPALQEGLAHGRVLELGAFHGGLGHLGGGLAAQHGLHELVLGPQLAGGLLQPPREHEDFLLLVVGGRHAETGLGGLQVRVAELGQTLLAGLGFLIGDADEGEAVAEQGGVRGAHVQAVLGQFAGSLDGLGDLRPALAGLLGELGILGDLGAQVLLGGLDARHGLLVLQARPVARGGLDAVLDAEDLGVDLAGGFRRGLGVGHHGGLAALHGLEAHGDGGLGGVLHLGQGVLAAGAAGVPGHEGEVAGLETGAGPLEEVLGLVGLAVLVDAEEGEVQVVAREGEVVGVAAEEGDLHLRREDQAHVGVLLVAVDPVLAALVEGHVLAGEATLLLHGLLDLLDLDLTGLLGVLLGQAGLDGLGEGLGDVVHGHERHQLQARHLDFLVAAGGGEAVLHVVGLLAAHALDPAPAHMVVGEHQAVLADEGAGAPGEAQG